MYVDNCNRSQTSSDTTVLSGLMSFIEDMTLRMEAIASTSSRAFMSIGDSFDHMYKECEGLKKEVDDLRKEVKAMACKGGKKSCKGKGGKSCK